MKKEFYDIIAFLIIDNPFFALLLRSIPVYASEDIDLAATFLNGIVINPKQFSKLSNSDKIFTLIHELKHILDFHPIRLNRIYRNLKIPLLLLNAIADAKVNQTIMDDFPPEKLEVVTPREIETKLGIQDVRKKSIEEIVRELIKNKEMLKNEEVIGIIPKPFPDIPDYRTTTHEHELPEETKSPPTQTSESPQPSIASEDRRVDNKKPKETLGARETPSTGKRETLTPNTSTPHAKTTTTYSRTPKAQSISTQMRPQTSTFSTLSGEKRVEEIKTRPSQKTLERDNATSPTQRQHISRPITPQAHIGVPTMHSKPIKIDTIINPGSNELRDFSNIEELVSTIKRIIVDSYIAAKLAGKVPGFIEEYINNLLKPRINWRIIVRGGLRSVLSHRIRRSYSYVNKKFFLNNLDMIPGKKKYGGHTALILVDTSGSINSYELKMFLSEIFAIFRHGNCRRIIVIPWDAKVYEPIYFRSWVDFKKIKITGRGGTKILPALKEAIKILKKYNKPTLIIVMSDFNVSETGEALKKVFSLMKNMTKYVELAIMLTTDKVWKIKNWTTIKLPENQTTQ